MSGLSRVDPTIAQAIQKESEREKNTINLIASENFASDAVLEAQGCLMTNKYAEGYPGKRYYGGCQWVDIVEDLAIKRAKQLFGAEHANVQPHSGTQANMAVYFATLKPGDTIMGMDLKHGGHLTHGSPANFSGQLYKVVSYGVDRETECLNYHHLMQLALKEQPKLIIAGASAYPREIDFIKFAQISQACGAYLMADIAHIAGLVAAGIHQSPVPHADFVTTSTHKTLRGPRGGLILCKSQYAQAIDKAIMPGMQGGPLMHVIAAKAVCFKEAQTRQFKEYQQRIVANAKELAKALQENGFRLVSGGTDNHLVLVDLTNKNISGDLAERVLEEVGIIVNKEVIPFESRSPSVTSGIRLGTPAITTRGMGTKEVHEIIEMITAVLSNINDKSIKQQVRKKVAQLCAGFPLHSG